MAPVLLPVSVNPVGVGGGVRAKGRDLINLIKK